MWELEFSMIDAKEYPVVILVKDGEWLENFDDDEMLENMQAAMQVDYLRLIKEAQKKIIDRYLPLLPPKSWPSTESYYSKIEDEEGLGQLYYT